MSDTAIVLTGKQDGIEIRFPLTDGRFVVGRTEECDLVLGNPSVSRRHASLLCSGGRVLVEDLGSHNGTRVNELPVTTPTPLSPGDKVSFADVALHFGEPRITRGELSLDNHRESVGLAVSWDEVVEKDQPANANNLNYSAALPEQVNF